MAGDGWRWRGEMTGATWARWGRLATKREKRNDGGGEEGAPKPEINSKGGR